MRRSLPVIMAIIVGASILLASALYGAGQRQGLQDRVERLIRDKGILRVRLEAVSQVCRGAIELGVQR